MYITFMTSSECDHGLLWLFKHLLDRSDQATSAMEGEGVPSS